MIDTVVGCVCSKENVVDSEPLGRIRSGSLADCRDEFRPAFDACMATGPFTDPEALLTPFVMPEYRLAADTLAGRLDQAAEQSSARVWRDIQRASNYVLAVVLFAAALSLPA